MEIIQAHQMIVQKMLDNSFKTTKRPEFQFPKQSKSN